MLPQQILTSATNSTQTKIKNLSRSTPSVTDFDPTIIKSQIEVIRDIRKNFDYSKGTHEILLSGSVGSSKSLLLAHIAVTHCMLYPRARFLIGRRSMPDLKSTIFQKILEHLEGSLIEGVDYQPNYSNTSIYFRNGSEIISKSWADGHYHKMRSLELSAAAIEELSENDLDDRQAYMEILARVGRITHVPESFVLCATNPDSPSHWIYNHWMLSQDTTRKVYYSVTSDNPFLPPQYIDKLKKTYDAKMVERMIYGKWIEIAGENVYYQYTRERNFKDETYNVDKAYPVRVSFDFNIGEGKPMSATVSQYINDTHHVYNESIIFSANTEQTLMDLEARGLLPKDQEIIIHGDASGRNRDTRSKTTDYDIIKSFLQKGGYRFKLEVPISNPAIRARHNIMNGYLCNSEGQVRFYVYKDAKTVDEGMRLVRLKEGGNYIEDDSKHYQHCCTSIGYCVMWIVNNQNRTNESRQL